MSLVNSTPTRRPMQPIARPLALVTGASSGIGFELARCCAEDGHDLIVVADNSLDSAVAALEATGAEVQAVQADLATTAGVDAALAALQGRPLQMLIANAGTGLGRTFLEQDFAALRHIIDTNVTGTLELIHRVAQGMQTRRNGRILITGSIAGFIPGPHNAVYNASKAFIDSFAQALRNELDGSGITVTCLMPGATDTAFFEQADMQNTALGKGPKDSPSFVADKGYAALKAGLPGVITGWKNKLQVAAASITPAPVMAAVHSKLARQQAGPR
ncbi:MAG: SDR family NAD(P)-dependent oxidoreductase [Rubrivivax sp.]|nr:SDR family NAD(P)-dependent oxidoreductase [Rubrivivax sp.]